MPSVRTTLLALLLPLAPAFAQTQAQPGPPPARMVVMGHAVIETAPDVATVSIGASARAATAAAAIDETSAATAKIVAAALAFGIERADIATSQVSLEQAFKAAPVPGNQRVPDGFEASNSVQVRVRNLAKLGEFLRRGVGDGANRIGSLSFGLLDRARTEREAGAAAANDAQARAEALAAASGVRLGRIVEIRWSDRGAGAPVAMGARAFSASAAPDVPAEPGQISVSAGVEMVWALEGSP